MPRGYRCILVVFVGWLSLAAAEPKGVASQPDRAAQSDLSGSLQNIATALQKANEPSQHDQPCGDSRDNRSSDLCAQWKAADAAQSGADATWLFGYIGTLLGLLTFAAAGAAAWYAKRAALATEQALLKDRAWLCPNGVGQHSMVDGSVDGKPIRNGLAFSIDWKNFGNVPAVRIGAVVWIESSDGGEIVKNIGIGDAPRNGISGPGNSHSTAVCFLDDAQSDAFRRQELRLKIRSQILYSDAIQGGEFSSRVAYLAAHQGGTIERGGKCIEAITFSIDESGAA